MSIRGFSTGADPTTQYDRVDPTEFQSLKDEVEALKTEKSAWEAQQITHTAESTELLEKVIVHTFAVDIAEPYGRIT